MLQASTLTPQGGVPVRLTLDGTEVAGTIVRALPDEITVAIDDGTQRTRSLHAPPWQMGYGNRDPDRFHYARVGQRGICTVTPHGRAVARWLLEALYRGYDQPIERNPSATPPQFPHPRGRRHTYG